MNQLPGATQPGLRERKKAQTRRLIFEAASRLFQERGFDAVTVAEVARAADVSEVTVFNHFGTKEDLFFGGLQTFEDRLVEAVADRPPGQSPFDVVRRMVVEGTANLAAEGTAETILRGARAMASSPALRSRHRDIVAASTDRMAGLLAVETGAAEADVEPRVVASALLAVHQAVVARTQAAILGGRRGAALAAEVRTQATLGFARLEKGVAGYAVRAKPGAAPS